MQRFEAVLHFGLTRSDPPTAAGLRDMFFACVVAAEVDSAETSHLALAIHEAYRAALVFESGDDEDVTSELVPAKEAEQRYSSAFASVYCPGHELPDGAGWWEHLPYNPADLWDAALITDLGHLMAYLQLATDAAFRREAEKYMAAEQGGA